MRGGYRQGSGRKKGLASIASEKAKAYIAERVVEELEPIITAVIANAKGEKPLKGMNYPNMFAVNTLFERAFGKVTDKLQFEEVKKLIKFDE